MDNTEQLLLDLKESVERALRDLLVGLRQETRAGFAEINAKFDAQGAIWDRELDELEEQLSKLKR